MEPPKKHCRRVSALVPSSIKAYQWESPYNKEGIVKVSSEEFADGTRSRVYIGEMNGKRVAVKDYDIHHGATLVKVYEQFFHLNHSKVVAIYGMCPKSGFVVLELCKKTIGDKTIHSLQDLMNMYRSELPLDIKVAALADITEGIEYLHNNCIIHGDIKPSNVLVSTDEDSDSLFKVTDYACPKVAQPQSSCLATFKQLMTPGYIAPELIPSNDSDSCIPLPPSAKPPTFMLLRSWLTKLCLPKKLGQMFQ